MTTLFTTDSPQTALSLPFPKGRQTIALNQIVRLEGEYNYTYCHFSDGRTLLVALTLKVLLDRLPPDSLVRLHRKHAVNPDYVAVWNTHEGYVRLHNGKMLTISRRRTSACRIHRNRPIDSAHQNSFGMQLLLRGLLPVLWLLALGGPACAQQSFALKPYAITLPRVTTTQKTNSATVPQQVGNLVYNTDQQAVAVHNGTGWGYLGAGDLLEGPVTLYLLRQVGKKLGQR